MAENSPETASSSSQPTPSQKSAEESLKQSQVPPFSSFPAFPDGYYQMLPVMYPALVPGLTHLQNDEQRNRGAGIYAVPVHPFMGHVAGLPSNTLIPLTYSTPTRQNSEAGNGSENQGQVAQQQQQQPAPQRQVVVRRFQIAFQIDLLLMLKLAAVIFLFNQEGSRQRLVVLVLFAALVYLYQTGALTPLIRWLSHGMHRAAAPPHPPRPAVRADNVPAAREPIIDAAPAEDHPEAEIRNQPTNDADRAVENDNVADPGGGNGGNQWWGIVKEIQMIVFGFITSLLPGFHNHMD